jgi:hypothetical protein
VCITANLTADWQLWVMERRTRREHFSSAAPQ